MIKKIGKGIGIILVIAILLFLILLVVPEKETVPPIQPRENTQYWQMEEGFNIAYTHLPARDDVKNSSIIFLHGGPGGYVHSSIIETLSDLTTLGHDVYLYDQRGSGLSDRMTNISDVSFVAHVQDLHEIITQQIKEEKVILIGQSFASSIIAHYSAQYPDRVEKIIFSSPGALLPWPQENGEYVDLEKRFPLPDSYDFVEPNNFVDDVQSMAIKPKALVATLGLFVDRKLISDKQMDRMLNTLASQFTLSMVCDSQNVLPEEGGGGLYAYLATNNTNMVDIRGTLRDSDIPIMVVQGQCDYIPYSSAYEYVDVYPNGQYQFVENAGHEIWWEQEEAYLDIIKSFLSEG